MLCEQLYERAVLRWLPWLTLSRLLVPLKMCTTPFPAQCGRLPVHCGSTRMRAAGRQLLLSPCPVEQRACAANATNFAQVRLQLTLLTHVGFEAAVEFGGGTAQR